MKELDQAIQNSDVDRIVFLLNQKVDCEGAVLMHLKDRLVPAHFSEENLRARGAIMSAEDLNQAIARYTEMGFSSEAVDTYRMDFYVKRLYLSAEQALKAWQTGRLQNQTLENTWDLDAMRYLVSEWIKGTLPETIQKYVKDEQDSYIASKYQAWVMRSLYAATSQVLDELLLTNLRNHWYMGNESADPVCQQIRSNIIDEVVKLVQGNSNAEITKKIIAFLRAKALEQVFNGDINNETIKYALDNEVAILLKGRTVVNLGPYYEQAVQILFTKWQAGNLSEQALADVTNYVKKQSLIEQLSGELKAKSLESTIPQLLSQYREGTLPAEAMKQLALQFKDNIVGHYEKDASKETAFRNELGQVIFTRLLAKWKAQKLAVDPTALKYLQTQLLSDLQKSLQEFGLPTSRFTLFVMVRRLAVEVSQLKGELLALKTSKESTPLAQVSGDKPKESAVSLATAAQQLGVFTPAQSTSSALSKDLAVIPKQGPGSK